MTAKTISELQFRNYCPEDSEAVKEIFCSNIPKYFNRSEEAGLREFLSRERPNYYVLAVGGKILGAGGIALNDDDTVSLCWGMVHNDHLGTGLGKALTDYRIAKARTIFGEKPLVIVTSQHTEGFYQKYGFVTVEFTRDGFAAGIDTYKMRLG